MVLIMDQKGNLNLSFYCGEVELIDIGSITYKFKTHFNTEIDSLLQSLF